MNNHILAAPHVVLVRGIEAVWKQPNDRRAAESFQSGKPPYFPIVQRPLPSFRLTCAKLGAPGNRGPTAIWLRQMPDPKEFDIENDLDGDYWKETQGPRCVSSSRTKMTRPSAVTVCWVIADVLRLRIKITF